MMCKNPFVRTPTGIKPLHKVLSRDAKLAATPLPCGQCLACRINKHREMKHRILLEQMAWEHSSFLTLTYEVAPYDGSLKLVDLQKFWKRLRKKDGFHSFRYFAVGEYGNDSQRPHYHAALFGIPADPVISGRIEQCWGLGFIKLGTLNKDSASYIAGYTLKKLTRKDDKRLNGRSPEFFVGSRKEGGIGSKGIKKLAQKLREDARFPKDKVITELQYGKYKMPLGRYLTEKLAKEMGTTERLLIEKEDYMDEVIMSNMEKEGIYRDNIVGEKKVKRAQQQKRHKIWESRKSRCI